MIAIKHFRECIVRPALDSLGLHTMAREELLVITCAQESLGGTYLMQCDSRGYPQGPALGLYQMEPNTFQDMLDNFLRYRMALASKVTGMLVASRMVYDNLFATQIAALQYYRFPEKIPDDLEGQIRYYKKYWNTELGKATLAEVRSNYERFAKNG